MGRRKSTKCYTALENFYSNELSDAKKGLNVGSVYWIYMAEDRMQWLSVTLPTFNFEVFLQENY